MKSKKFVLAWLVLLAITGLLALAGCKNDTVPEPTRYTVKFETAHGTAPADITVVSGTKLTAEQLKGLADTADYIFEGWYDGETKAEGGTYTVTKDVTLVAKWKPRDQVQISFTVSGNTVELSSEPAGAAIYYTTDGTEPKESLDEYTKPIEISSKTTIKAYAEKLGELKESEVAEKTYLVVTFDANGGSEVAPQEVVESGQPATKPTNLTNGDMVLAGWYTSEDDGTTLADTAYSFDAPVAGDITFYAWWLPKPGTVVRNGLTINDVTLEKTSEVQVLSTAVDLSSLVVAGSSSEVFISGRSGEIQPFVMGQYEVTQQLYFAVMESNPSYFTSEKGETQELWPVERVSWYDAVVFCNRLSQLMGLEPVYSKGGTTNTSEWREVPISSDEGWNAITCDFTKSGYRLPTEAEWELAARGGDPMANAWKDTYAGTNDESTLKNYAWYSYKGSDSKTHQVGTKAANSLELYDMSGNVWEWCWDWWASSITEATPSGGATSGSGRVSRGGSWYEYAGICTVSYRNDDRPSLRSGNLGFRLVRSNSK